VIDGVEVPVADFTHSPTHCKFLAFMPQWDFLDFLVQNARAFPSFRIHMRAEVTDLIEEQGVIRGVRVSTPEGALEVRADLTIGADGRHSIVRERARLPVEEVGAPIDVLWMRVSHREGDPDQPLGRFDRGQILIMLYRGDYWQCGFVISKGGFDAIRAAGLAAFQDRIAEIAPMLRDRVAELDSWDAVKLLTVKVDRLNQWHRPGLLCIGDSAHAMSPVGGVGINLAIQDAVAAANLLADSLSLGTPSFEQLDHVRQRRERATRWTQKLQVFIQDRVLTPVLQSQKPLVVPWPLRLLQRFPWLRRIPARIIGIGFQPEHIRSPVAASHGDRVLASANR
jgi:2-polyprenyl-6-methoxyphenol hydroxylase-like FAD-dependent oxidoreductase